MMKHTGKNSSAASVQEGYSFQDARSCQRGSWKNEMDWPTLGKSRELTEKPQRPQTADSYRRPSNSYGSHSYIGDDFVFEDQQRGRQVYDASSSRHNNSHSRNRDQQHSWRGRHQNHGQSWRSQGLDQRGSTHRNNVENERNSREAMERMKMVTPRMNGSTISKGWSSHEDSNANRTGDRNGNGNGKGSCAGSSETASQQESPSLSSAEAAQMPAQANIDYQLMLYRQAVLDREADDEGGPHIVGSCPDMCPVEEREKRARLRDLAVFERVNDDQSKTSKELAVKKFCRTFSGKDLKQSDVRPLPVLCRTMQHLLRIIDVDSYPFEVIHDFLFDRTRAIRQELSMQRIFNDIAISIYENIVRFHIVSERELRQRAFGKVFDSHLNSQQLSKALLSLLNLYLLVGGNDGNEAEFCCYYVLLNLGQPQQLSLWLQTVRPALLRSSDVQFARDVLRCYQQKNFCGFFRLARKAIYLQACLMELYFNEVRASAIKMINHGAYKLHPYPLLELADLLLMEAEDMEEFCSLHGLAVGVSRSNEVQLLVKQAEFTTPKQSLRHYHCQIIENKRPEKLQQLWSSLKA